MTNGADTEFREQKSFSMIWILLDIGKPYSDGIDNDGDGAIDEGIDEGIDEMIDESRDDYIDNDGDWSLADDVGINGDQSGGIDAGVNDRPQLQVPEPVSRESQILIKPMSLNLIKWD